MGSPLAADSPVVATRVTEGLPLVLLIARQLHRASRAVTIDDLRSAGHEALVLAARTFDDSLGVPFRRWANIRIRGAMIDVIRSSGEVPRHVYARLSAIEAGDRMQETYIEQDASQPAANAVEADQRLAQYLAGIATAMAVGLLVPGANSRGGIDEAADPNETPEEVAARREMSDRLRAAIEERPEAERKLILSHYFEGASLEAAGKELGLSKSWASRLHARAIEGIAKSMARRE